jgi:hypothetical protein
MSFALQRVKSLKNTRTHFILGSMTEHLWNRKIAGYTGPKRMWWHTENTQKQLFVWCIQWCSMTGFSTEHCGCNGSSHTKVLYSQFIDAIRFLWWLTAGNKNLWKFGPLRTHLTFTAQKCENQLITKLHNRKDPHLEMGKPCKHRLYCRWFV